MKKIIAISFIGFLISSGFGVGSDNNNDIIEFDYGLHPTNSDLIAEAALPMMGISKHMFVGEGNANFLSSDYCISDYVPISRDRIMEIAEGFLHHEWSPTEANIFHDIYRGSGVDTPDRDTYTDWPDDHGWKANQPASSLPYQWGGFSSISGYNLSSPQDFDEQYTGTGSYEGVIHFAGDIDSTGYCGRACGLDCSGFVSRCWDLPMKHGTYTLPSIVSPIRFDELLRGDILNIPRYHVILFKEFIDEEKTLIRTIECGGPAPNVNEHVYRVTTISDDGFSVTLDAYGLSRKFGLYRYELIENAPGTPALEGPVSGNAGTEYTYTCVTTDPEGDLVSYCVDWGDNAEIQWFGPFSSGEQISVSHVWEKPGTYLIRVKAKDVHDIESGWVSLGIEMPKTKHSLFIEYLEEKYPFLITFFFSYINYFTRSAHLL